jgi:hypothetical protein
MQIKGLHKKDASNNSSNVACVFVEAVTFLPSRCQAHRLIARFWCFDILVLTNFIKIRCAIQKLMGIHRQYDVISLRVAVCVCPLSTSECLNNLFEIWYLHHGTWPQLKGVLHKSFPSVCVYKLTVARLGRHVPAAMNTHNRTTVGGAVSYQRRVCGPVCLSFIVASKHLPTATKNWRRRYLCGSRRIKEKLAISS